MRGERSIFLSLFTDDTATTTAAAPERKGRSEDLLQKRNELLICRHYYYTRIVELQYARALERLEDELYLSQRTIINIVNDNYTLLKKINSEKPEVKYFKTKFPFMVWN